MRVVGALLVPGQPARDQRQLVGVGREALCQTVSCWHGYGWRAGDDVSTSSGTLRGTGLPVPALRTLYRVCAEIVVLHK